MQKSVGSPSWLREGSAAAENVNLWLRWPEAGMLRTVSHSESEAAERTVRPWILWTLLRRLSKARRGTVFYSLSPPPSPHFSTMSSLSPQASFYSCFKFFHTHSLYPHALARTSPLSIKPQVLFFSCRPPPSQSLKLGIYSRKTETRSSFHMSTFRPQGRTIKAFLSCTLAGYFSLPWTEPGVE